MYMSLLGLPADKRAEELAKITDPEKKQMVEAFFSLQDQADSLRKNKLDEAAAARQARVERICKMMPKDTRDKVLAALVTPGAALSLTPTGVVNDPMDVMLSTLEDGLKIVDEQLKKASETVTEQKRPVEAGGMTDEEAAKLADQQFNRAGRMNGNTKAA